MWPPVLSDLLFKHLDVDYLRASALGRVNKEWYARWHAFALRDVPTRLMRFYRGAMLRCVVSNIPREIQYSVQQLVLPPAVASDFECVRETVIHGMPVSSNDIYGLARQLKCSIDDLRRINGPKMVGNNHPIKSILGGELLRETHSLHAFWSPCGRIIQMEPETEGELLRKALRYGFFWADGPYDMVHGQRIISAARTLIDYVLSTCNTHPLLTKHILSEAAYGSLHAMPFVLSAYLSLPDVNRHPRLPVDLFHGKHCVVEPLDLAAYCLFYAITAVFYKPGGGLVPQFLHTTWAWRFNVTNGLFFDNAVADSIVCSTHPIVKDNYMFYISMQRYLRRQLYLQPPLLKNSLMQSILPKEWNFNVVWTRVSEAPNGVIILRDLKSQFGLPDILLKCGALESVNIVSRDHKKFGRAWRAIDGDGKYSFGVNWYDDVMMLRGDFGGEIYRCRVLRLLHHLSTTPGFNAATSTRCVTCNRVLTSKRSNHGGIGAKCKRKRAAAAIVST